MYEQTETHWFAWRFLFSLGEIKFKFDTSHSLYVIFNNNLESLNH